MRTVARGNAELLAEQMPRVEARTDRELHYLRDDEIVPEPQSEARRDKAL